MAKYRGKMKDPMDADAFPSRKSAGSKRKSTNREHLDLVRPMPEKTRKPK